MGLCNKPEFHLTLVSPACPLDRPSHPVQIVLMAGWTGIRDYFSLRTLRLCGEKLLDSALSGVLTFLGFTAINEQNLPVDEGAVYEVVESTQDVG